VSLIGTLEQFSLPNVLRRLENFEKTGLLVLKQEAQWIEMNFHEGRLLCVGPLRTQATLGERLLQDGLISLQALQQVLRALGSNGQNESLTAQKLLELNSITRAQLRSWVVEKTVDVLRVLLLWSSGNIYFDEGTPLPTDRLLVSMSISELLESALAQPQVSTQTPPSAAAVKAIHTSSRHPAIPKKSEAVAKQPLQREMVEQKRARVTQPIQPQEQPSITQKAIVPPKKPDVRVPSFDIAPFPTLTDETQFTSDAPFAPSTMASSSTAPFAPSAVPPSSAAPFAASAMIEPDVMDTPDGEAFAFLSSFDESSNNASASIMMPEHVMNPERAKRLDDISFMQPDMVLWPADLSGYREADPVFQLTPDQWRVLTYVDGRTQLQVICQVLQWPPEFVCIIAGELIAAGIIHIAKALDAPLTQSTVNSQDLGASMMNGLVAPGSAATTAQPWSVMPPDVAFSQDMVQPLSPLPLETESQWGNGGNGAKFVPGRGWITNAQPVQP
jgi:hypothetical protein